MRLTSLPDSFQVYANTPRRSAIVQGIDVSPEPSEYMSGEVRDPGAVGQLGDPGRRSGVGRRGAVEAKGTGRPTELHRPRTRLRLPTRSGVRRALDPKRMRLVRRQQTVANGPGPQQAGSY